MDPLAACCFFVNATLSEPETTVVARLGEVSVRTLASGTATAEYALDRARAKETIVFKNGRVVSISLQESGLSDEASILPELSGRPPHKNGVAALWKYGYAKGRVAAVSLSASNATLAGLEAIAPPALHDGTSFENALINGAADEASSAQNEEVFLAQLRCNGNRDTWRELSQLLVQHDGIPYDVFKLACSSGSEQREVYFNISSSFGKL